MIKKTDHLVITTAKPSECIDFYEKLGFNVREGNGRYELFAGDFKINVHIKGNELSPHAENVMPGSADLCFEVTDNIDDFKAELETKNIQVELGVVDRNGVNGPMKSVYLRDPDGNLVEFCNYAH